MYSSNFFPGLGHVERPTHHSAVCEILGFRMDVRGLLNERERRVFADAEIQMHEFAFRICVHEMKRGARGVTEPVHVARVSVDRHDAHVRVLFRFENPVRAAGLHAIEIGRGGEDREDHVLFGDRKIVHQRNVGNLEPFLLYELALFVRHA